MKRSLATFFFSCLLIPSFSQKKDQASIDYLAIYSQAEKLFEKAKLLSDKADFDEKTQKLQNHLYAGTLSKLQEALKKAPSAANDSLSFHIFVKMGESYYYTFDYLMENKIVITPNINEAYLDGFPSSGFNLISIIPLFILNEQAAIL